MIGILIAFVAYAASAVWAFREATRRPERSTPTIISMLLFIAMSVVFGNVITGGE